MPWRLNCHSPNFKKHLRRRNVRVMGQGVEKLGQWGEKSLVSVQHSQRFWTIQENLFIQLQSPSGPRLLFASLVVVLYISFSLKQFYNSHKSLLATRKPPSHLHTLWGSNSKVLSAGSRKMQPYFITLLYECFHFDLREKKKLFSNKIINQNELWGKDWEWCTGRQKEPE